MINKSIIILLVCIFMLSLPLKAQDSIHVCINKTNIYTKTELDSAISIHQSWLREIESYLRYKFDISEKDNEYYEHFYNLLYQPEDSVEKTFKTKKSRLVFNGEIKGVYLENARLNGAGFSDIKAKNTVFNKVDLRAIEVYRGEINTIEMIECSLRFSKFYSSLMDINNFIKTDIRNIYFGGDGYIGDISYHDISYSKLIDVNLVYGKFEKTNLKNVVYAPQNHPNPKNIAYAKNLEKIKYTDDPAPLFGLKNLLRSAGFTKAEKKVNAAIKRHDYEIWEKILFDLTCEYGSNYFRPLLIDLFIWIIFSIIFTIKIIGDLGEIEQRNIGFFIRKQERKLHPWDKDDFYVQKIYVNHPMKIRDFLRALRLGSFISLMSATRIGFREVNMANWLKMMLPFELDIKAQGWPRVVTGIQSVFSVYLITLSLISYFGRPFDVG